jgi:hypothetical protein
MRSRKVIPVLTPEQIERRGTITAAARTICDMTLLAGASPATAFLVAAELAYGLEDPELRPRRWVRL